MPLQIDCERKESERPFVVFFQVRGTLHNLGGGANKLV